MDSSGNKVTAVRSDDGCDSTIDANAVMCNSMNYTDFWSVAYGVDVTSFDTTGRNLPERLHNHRWYVLHTLYLLSTMN